jgi:hypothetical protein
MMDTLDLTALRDDFDVDDPASITVRAALGYEPTPAETLFLDPAEGGVPDRVALDWLAAQGVPIEALASPIAVRAAHVCFDGRGRYVPNVVGDFAMILPATNPLSVTDWCAWAPRSGQTATRRGRGALLGGHLVGRSIGDGVTIPPLPVFESPLDWLRASRHGIVILDPERAAVALAGVVIEATDNAHAAVLRRLLRIPAPVIRVRHSQRLAA